MKTYITEAQVYDDVDCLICTLKAFDEETFTVEFKDAIPMAHHLRYVADLIDDDSVLYKKLEDLKGDK